jgi:hypothetical protein
MEFCITNVKRERYFRLNFMMDFFPFQQRKEMIQDQIKDTNSDSPSKQEPELQHETVQVETPVVETTPDFETRPIVDTVVQTCKTQPIVKKSFQERLDVINHDIQAIQNGICYFTNRNSCRL